MFTVVKSVFATLVVVLLVGVLPVSAWAETGSQAQVSVIVRAANVRQGPGTSYPVMDVVHKGDTMAVTGQNSAAGWYQVSLADGQTGWIRGDLVNATGQVDRIPEVATPPPAKAASADTGRSTSSQRAGSTIVFQVSSGGDIYVVKPDGSGLRKLTTGLDPALSPDGKQVAFTRWHGSSSGDYGSVWVINTDGTRETPDPGLRRPTQVAVMVTRRQTDCHQHAAGWDYRGSDTRKHLPALQRRRYYPA